MDSFVRPEDVKIVNGRSGRGIQVVCSSCGCVNMNYLEDPEATWECRNCRRVFTHYFPGLVEQALAREKQEAAAPASTAAT